MNTYRNAPCSYRNAPCSGYHMSVQIMAPIHAYRNAPCGYHMSVQIMAPIHASHYEQITTSKCPLNLLREDTLSGKGWLVQEERIQSVLWAYGMVSVKRDRTNAFSSFQIIWYSKRYLGSVLRTKNWTVHHGVTMAWIFNHMYEFDASSGKIFFYCVMSFFANTIPYSCWENIETNIDV